MIKALILLNFLIAGTMLTLFTYNHFYYGGNHSIIFGTWLDHFFQQRLLATGILTIPMIILLFRFKNKALFLAMFLTILCSFLYYSITGILTD
jgi:hypothetical protein